MRSYNNKSDDEAGDSDDHSASSGDNRAGNNRFNQQRGNRPPYGNGNFNSKDGADFTVYHSAANDGVNGSNPANMSRPSASGSAFHRQTTNAQMAQKDLGK